MKIGPYQLENNLILAPMAGVTDRPFRQLCKDLGAAVAVGEMLSANPLLRNTRKSLLRSNHQGETGIRWVQIAGAEAKMLAEAAQYNTDRGADIIDINMGCPAKKVCRKSAGSALLADEALVEDICLQVVEAVDVPVTLKIRTGTTRENRNAVNIAKIAERTGISALSIHGRARSDKFQGDAEYKTIREVRDSVDITLIANGDIDSPEKAKQVLAFTQADGLMIGRAAQGRPWIFRDIAYYLQTGTKREETSLSEIAEIMLRHIAQLHDFYGFEQGVRIARKHVGWYLNSYLAGRKFKQHFNKINDAKEQLIAIASWFDNNKLQTAD
ncbi:MAG: tRNA dihydrouridine synthase DusB [Gammaproteobacteria bacterium]|nr:MAG: tRNA dihydrouridine synthase DusB [Gammaproteobacteria bacterium]